MIPVEHGELASGLVGDGRMAEPETIFAYLQNFFSRGQELKGKRALVTAGPTYEAIDPVRFIGNHSSGKMGMAIAEELCSRGAEVTLVCGPVALPQKNNGMRRINVTSAEEMYQACRAVKYDVAVMAAAVADYTPVNVADKKIKKGGDGLHLELKRTTDILASLGKGKRDGQLLVGFALETDNEKENAVRKLREKNVDLIVLNSLQDEGAGFGHDTNKATFLFRDGSEKALPLQSKTALAKDLVDSLIQLIK